MPGSHEDNFLIHSSHLHFADVPSKSVTLRRIGSSTLHYHAPLVVLSASELFKVGNDKNLHTVRMCIKEFRVSGDWSIGELVNWLIPFVT